MTPEKAIIYAAIIGIAGTVLVALITTCGPYLFQLVRSKDRRFTGQWSGKSEDILIPGQQPYDYALKYQLILQLKRRGDSVTGHLSIVSDEPKKFSANCKVKSIELTDDYISLKYAIKDQDISHFGIALLELVGKDLQGFFLSKKLHERRIGFGIIQLKRV